MSVLVSRFFTCCLCLLYQLSGFISGGLALTTLLLDTSHASTSTYLCEQIPMPTKSHFTGLEPPTDAVKWAQALADSCAGKLILLQKVLDVTTFSDQSSDDIYSDGDDHRAMWTHNLADIHLSGSNTFSDGIKKYYKRIRHVGHSNNSNVIEPMRAPIIHLGIKSKRRRGYPPAKFSTQNLCDFQQQVPAKMVVLGCADQNWGFLSTNLMNRSIDWRAHLHPTAHKGGPDGQGRTSQDLLQAFLDHPAVLMFLVTGHHNISHPKLVSMPLGPTNAASCTRVAQDMMKENRVHGSDTYRKRSLLLTAGSNFRFRPAIRECVRSNMGDDLLINREMLSLDKYLLKVAESVAVLCMPGLGYDTYRTWESVLMGAMPVVEKGCGMDKTFWKLPVLVVDDFAFVTPELVQSAYVEALYRRDEWEYRRLLKSFWKDLVTSVSETKNSQKLLEVFPEIAEDSGFTRPLFAFNCQEMGGCGPGTKRTPAKYCAIDRNINYNKPSKRLFANDNPLYGFPYK